MNALAIQQQDVIAYDFHGGSIRAIEIGGELWFVANDVADAIGYADAADSVYKITTRNSQEFEGCKGVAKLSTPGGLQEFTTFNEFGLYSFCMLARTDKATEFRIFARNIIANWRKGQYQNHQPMSIEDAVIIAMQGLKEIREQQSQQQQEIRRLAVVVDNEIWLTEHQKAEIQNIVKWRVGWLKREGYAATFQGIYSALKTHFDVPKYDKIPRKSYDHAISFVRGWYPPRR